MKMIICLSFLVAFAVTCDSAYVSPRNGQVVYLPENKGIVSMHDAKKFCENAGGFLPFNFTVTERNLIGTLFNQASNTTFWIGAYKGTDNQYRWTETETNVAADLWKRQEPSGDGYVVLMLEPADSSVGLYVYPVKTDFHLTVCQIDLSTKDQIEQVHKKWQKLPYEDLEPLEKMLIETHFNDPMPGVKAKLEDLDKRTGASIRNIRQEIEQLKVDMREEIRKLREELKPGMEELRKSVDQLRTFFETLSKMMPNLGH